MTFIKNPIPILSNGHGGVINGEYQTAGKRSPDWDKGVLYEGMFNRWIVNKIILQLDYACVPYFHVSPEFRDVGLSTRIERVNKIQTQFPNAYLMDHHANAGGGTGIEGFTSVGQTFSDPMMEEFLKDLETAFPNVKPRFDYTDGDRDKERDYYVLTRSKGMAGLLELGFMDFKPDYDLLWDQKHQDKLALVIAGTMIRLYNHGLQV